MCPFAICHLPICPCAISPSSLLTIQTICTHFAPILHPFCTALHRFAPFCTRFAPFCTILPVLQGPGGEWVSVVAVSIQAWCLDKTLPWHCHKVVDAGRMGFDSVLPEQIGGGGGRETLEEGEGAVWGP